MSLEEKLTMSKGMSPLTFLVMAFCWLCMGYIAWKAPLPVLIAVTGLVIGMAILAVSWVSRDRRARASRHEEVECGAMAIFYDWRRRSDERLPSDVPGYAWEDLNDDVREDYRHSARAVLAATGLRGSCAKPEAFTGTLDALAVCKRELDGARRVHSRLMAEMSLAQRASNVTEVLIDTDMAIAHEAPDSCNGRLLRRLRDTITALCMAADRKAT